MNAQAWSFAQERSVYGQGSKRERTWYWFESKKRW